jgi:spore coat protein D
MHHQWLPPRVLPPVVGPTNINQVDIYHPHIVPHIHPSHTQYNHHNIYNHQHYTTHTTSECCDVYHQHFFCGPIPPPHC